MVANWNRLGIPEPDCCKYQTRTLSLPFPDETVTVTDRPVVLALDDEVEGGTDATDHFASPPETLERFREIWDDVTSIVPHQLVFATPKLSTIGKDAILLPVGMGNDMLIHISNGTRKSANIHIWHFEHFNFAVLSGIQKLTGSEPKYKFGFRFPALKEGQVLIPADADTKWDDFRDRLSKFFPGQLTFSGFKTAFPELAQVSIGLESLPLGVIDAKLEQASKNSRPDSFDVFGIKFPALARIIRESEEI